MRDVSYFLSLGLDIDDRRDHERDLIRHYLDVRDAGGGSAITFDEAWRPHRLLAAYLVPACCQVVTFPADMSEQRACSPRRSSARSEAALADLESAPRCARSPASDYQRQTDTASRRGSRRSGARAPAGGRRGSRPRSGSLRTASTTMRRDLVGLLAARAR